MTDTPADGELVLGPLPPLPEEVWLRALAHALDPDAPPVPAAVLPDEGEDLAAPAVGVDDPADPDGTAHDDLADDLAHGPGDDLAHGPADDLDDDPAVDEPWPHGATDDGTSA